MDELRESLIESARKIAPPSASTSDSLKRLSDVMACDLTDKMNKKDDLETLIGAGNRPLMEMNHVNHFDYVSSLTALYDPVSFVETVIWVFRNYIGKGFAPDYWQVMLPEAMDVLDSHLSEEQYLEARSIYSWLHEHIPHFVQIAASTESFYETLGNMQGVLDDDE